LDLLPACGGAAHATATNAHDSMKARTGFIFPPKLDDWVVCKLLQISCLRQCPSRG
jgi:hypothetical protein